MIRKLFRRPQAPLAPKRRSEQEIARLLAEPEYLQEICGPEIVAHVGVVHPEAPFGWKNPPPPRPDADFEMSGAEMLTENYARRDGENLVRALLPVPIKETEARIFLGVWCSLTTGNHARYRSGQQRGDADKLGELFSWLYTQVPPTTGPVITEGVLLPLPDGQPPLYWITSPKHPFAKAQQEGLSAQEILDLYSGFGRADIVEALIG